MSDSATTVTVGGPAEGAGVALRRWRPGASTEVLLGAALLGSAGAAAAYAPSSTTPTTLGFARLVLGSLVLTASMPLLGGSRRRLLDLARHRAVWVAAVCTALYQPLFFTAAERAGVAMSTLLTVGTVPLASGALGWAVLHQRPSRRWVAATAVAVCGLALRSWSELTLDDLTGALFALAAGVAVACYVISTKLELDRGEHTVELAAASYVIAAALTAPFVLAGPWGWMATTDGIAVAVYLGVMTMAVGNVLTIRGMVALPPGHSATLMLSDPIMGTLLGVAVLGEHLSVTGAAGIAIVLGALTLLARSPR